jgi:hypothetical protein
MKPDDLSAPDYIRWAVADPKNVTLWARGPASQSRVFNRLKADVLRSRVVVFDKAATDVIARVASLPPADLLRAALSARMPWPAAIVIFDYAHFLQMTVPDSRDVDPEAPNEFPILISADETGARGVASALGRMKVTQTGAMVGLTVEPVSIRFDFSGETLPRPDPGCRESVRRRMTANLEAIHARARMNMDTQPTFAMLSDKGRAAVESVLSDVMLGRPHEDAWTLGSAYLPPSFGTDGGIHNWQARITSETADMATIGRTMTPVWSPYCSPRDFDGKGGWDDEMMTQPIMEARGTGRIILAIMAILGESGSTVIETTRPAGSRMVGHRRTPFMAVSNIRIDLSRLIVTRPRDDAPQGPSRSIKVEHQVRGHWVHYLRQGRPGCLHFFAPAGEAGRRQECACGAFRVWRSEHIRGSAAAGYAFMSPVTVTA